jgi:hypothetical protein
MTATAAKLHLNGNPSLAVGALLGAPAALAESGPAPEPNALLAQLAALHAQLKRLEELAGEKLDALRKADTSTLHRCAAEEGELLEGLYGRDPRQPAVLAGLAQQLRGAGRRGARLSELAQEYDEPIASRIRARLAGLGEIAARLEKKNRLAASVARGLHEAVRAALEDVRQARREPVGYEASGKLASRARDGWIDAIG